ncbi:MAG: transketolase [Deltaproteobacteria bacterium HGW-Deltaproteobacteria-19]|jgi:transketolase|nr:MAG: transketolase [Deltaproteobacteria bacterium HGW-Deltaproteobacteria-19]
MTETLGIREAYGEALVELGRENRDIVVLDADLSGSTMTKLFAREYPERFFDMGVAEQDMMGTAAGLALAGKTAFASTFAVFATGRAWEQIRQAVAYPQLSVKIVASHGGVSVGEDGASHQMTEDLALMRAMPNMRVIVPADAHETRAIIRVVAETPGPFYVRTSRMKFPVIYKPDVSFRLGRGDVLRPGSDVSIIACGYMVHQALKAAETLQARGRSARVVNMPTLKPIDEELILACARETKGIVTAEEHSIIGGLGSAVCEVLSENRPSPVRRVGVRDRFCSSGTAAELFKEYGLTAEDIVRTAEEMLRTSP